MKQKREKKNQIGQVKIFPAIIITINAKQRIVFVNDFNILNFHLTQFDPDSIKFVVKSDFFFSCTSKKKNCVAFDTDIIVMQLATCADKTCKYSF